MTRSPPDRCRGETAVAQGSGTPTHAGTGRLGTHVEPRTTPAAGSPRDTEAGTEGAQSHGPAETHQPQVCETRWALGGHHGCQGQAQTRGRAPAPASHGPRAAAQDGTAHTPLGGLVSCRCCPPPWHGHKEPLPAWAAAWRLRPAPLPGAHTWGRKLAPVCPPGDPGSSRGSCPVLQSRRAQLPGHLPSQLRGPIYPPQRAARAWRARAQGQPREPRSGHTRWLQPATSPPEPRPPPRLSLGHLPA